MQSISYKLQSAKSLQIAIFFFFNNFDIFQEKCSKIYGCPTPQTNMDPHLFWAIY